MSLQIPLTFQVEIKRLELNLSTAIIYKRHCNFSLRFLTSNLINNTYKFQ
jgi:hypothetical protein